jgi:hypothetical protein
MLSNPNYHPTEEEDDFVIIDADLDSIENDNDTPVSE